MVRYVKVWVEDAQCVQCGKTYKLKGNGYFYQRHICDDCYNGNRKRENRISRVKTTSFFLPPLGFLMYYLWKDKKPYYAKPALKYALISVGILLFCIILIFSINASLPKPR